MKYVALTLSFVLFVAFLVGVPTNVDALDSRYIEETRIIELAEPDIWQTGGDFGELSDEPRWNTELLEQTEFDFHDIDLDSDRDDVEIYFDSPVTVSISFMNTKLGYEPAIEIGSLADEGEEIYIQKWVLLEYLGQKVQISANDNFDISEDGDYLIIEIDMTDTTIIQFTGVEDEIGNGWYSLLPFTVGLFAFTSAFLQRTDKANPFKISNKRVQQYIWVLGVACFVLGIMFYQGIWTFW